MNDNELDRIISNFMEINAEILDQEINSNYPKFISRIIAKHYRNKLLKSLSKLDKGNVPLSYDNIYELFVYLLNNYMPDGAFSNVKYVKIINTVSKETFLESIIVLDGIIYEFKFNISDNASSKKEFQLLITNSNERYDVTLTKLYLESDNSKLRKIISDLNTIIYSIIKEYLYEAISVYNSKDTKGYLKKE